MNNYDYCFYFFRGRRAPSGPGPPHYRGFTITDTHTYTVGLPWTSDRPIAETSTWQHTSATWDGCSCTTRVSQPSIQAGEWQQTSALDRAAIGIGNHGY